jgi:deoxycytidylate deaminase
MHNCTWEETAMHLAESIANDRSEHPLKKVGACILRHDNSVAGVGYNGAVPGIEIDWSTDEGRDGQVLHAEENALEYVTPGEGKLIACTLFPCKRCFLKIVKKGIRKIVYKEIWQQDNTAFKLAQDPKYNIELIKL